jgi:hypothetical protein
MATEVIFHLQEKKQDGWKNVGDDIIVGPVTDDSKYFRKRILGVSFYITDEIEYGIRGSYVTAILGLSFLDATTKIVSLKQLGSNKLFTGERIAIKEMIGTLPAALPDHRWYIQHHAGLELVHLGSQMDSYTFST